MIALQEENIRGLEGYKGTIAPSTLDFVYAETVRGYKHRSPAENPVHIDTWEEPGKPDKLVSTSQITGRWTGSIEACLAELDYMSYKIPGFNVTLHQESGNPGPRGFHCVVGSDKGVLAQFHDSTFQLAILKCAIELALFHKYK